MNIDVISVVLCNLDINEYEEIVNGLLPSEQKRVAKYWKIHTKYDVKENKYCTRWYRNGKEHRDGDLPAVVLANGKEWWKNGERHRDGDLPAIEYVIGTKCWYKNGELHRDGDLPAVVCANGGKEWWKNGKQHRDGDLPAIVHNNNGYLRWFKNGVRYYPS